VNDELLDSALRTAAFDHVRRLVEIHGALDSKQILAGFRFQGERIPLVNPQRGIFKPQRMQRLLSIRTVYPKPGGKVWYDDQREVHREFFESDETINYAFMGDNPDAAENRYLREAMEHQVPIIYFVGISPGRYHVAMPAYIVEWDHRTLKARVAFSMADEVVYEVPEHVPDRRYALRENQRRLHQDSFREAVIHAYKGRCAISGLPEVRLLDAAHIVEDKHPELGQPIVPNGLPLSKIHHAAFDAHLIGIDPDYRVHVSGALLAQNDGPMLEALKGINGQKIREPRREQDRPDRERLALRFERFKAVA
jgi:putative restriction endonuclease